MLLKQHKMALQVLVGILASLVGIMVGMQSLGWPMPWQVPTREEVASGVRVQAIADDVKAIDTRVNTLNASFNKIDGKLDVIIQMLPKTK
jgi:hypothetical protein